MKSDYIKPNIVVSKCIEFENCRFNGQIIRSDFVSSLKPHVNFIPICPEYEIGLGIPREPIRIIKKENKRILVQPATEKDVTKDMNDFISSFFKDIGYLEGFILKSKSPSCGIKDVKVFPKMEKSAPIERSSGFFGKYILDNFKNIAIEDESRLRNSVIREHFLRKVFTYAQFRDVKKSNNLNKLIDFHTKNKLLILSYNQKEQKIMGNIVANRVEKSVEKMIEDYNLHLFNVFSRAPRCDSNINVLQHAYGYMKKELKSEEKNLLFDAIENFNQGRVAISVPISIIKSWITRFDVDYLKDQTYFDPYPEELMRVESVDVCSVRDYFK